MDLEKQFYQRIQNLGLARKKVLVAYSTGVDSTVLLHLLQTLPVAVRPQIYVAYIDHQIREQSVVETAYVKEYCHRQHLPLFVKVWPRADHPATGVEAAGREIRYHFFAETMQREGIPYLVTAHHANDQAETFLMKLLRGGDLEQLVGIRHQRQFQGKFRLVRPLLGISKATLRHYATVHQLKYFEDYTNHTDDYLRNRMRHNVVPRLQAENEQTLAHIQEYQDQLADVLMVAQAAAAAKLDEIKLRTGRYLVAYWVRLASPWQKLVLKELCRTQHVQITGEQLEQCVALLRNDSKPQGQVMLGQSWWLVKEYTVFYLAQRADNHVDSDEKYELKLNQWVNISAYERFGLFEVTTYQPELHDDVLKIDSLDKPLYIRHRRPHDQLKTTSGSQKVKRILIDHKIPRSQRDQIWLVTTDENEVLWVVGLKKSDLSRPADHAKIQYIIVHQSR